LNKICVGQNITTAPAKYSMARLLLSGESLIGFNTSATKHGNETNNDLKLKLQYLTTHIFPQRSLAFQTHYMRCYMRKLCEVTTQAFATRVAKLNTNLEEFPPFEDNQEMDDPEIMDILENGVPNTWSKNTGLQGFDLVESMVTEFVAFCEKHKFIKGTLDNSKVHHNEAKPKTNLNNSPNDAKSSAKPSAEAHKSN
jgi:hypothetical protein